jgi:hypothetical protein
VKEKRTVEGWKRIIDYSFEKLSFGEELGEQTRVSAGNPFRHSDSAVKLSVLAGRLEKPFRLFICRYWHCDSKRFIGEDFISDLKKRGHFFFGTWEVLGVFLELGASSFICCVLSIGLSFASSKAWYPWLGVIFSCDLCWSSFLGCVLSCWPCFSFTECCVFFLVLRGRQKGSCCCWSTSLVGCTLLAGRGIYH